MPRYEYDLAEHRVELLDAVRLADLRVDPDAQRILNERRAQRLADRFLPEAAGAVVVSRRGDGSLYLVDGQHRVRGALLAGVPTLPAEVHHDLSRRDEATLFLLKNREGVRPSALDEYRVGLTAGLPLFTDTDAELQRRDLTAGSTGPHTVGAVSGVLRLTEQYGPATLGRTLDVALAAWGRSDGRCWDGTLLGGVGTFLGKHGEDVDDDALLARKIAKRGTAHQWIGATVQQASAFGTQQAGGAGRLSACYRLVVSAWNAGRRTRRIGEPAAA
jgi:hypothetical protein